MAERLNALAYAHHVHHQQNPDSMSSFDPRRVSFDVRTPEELAAVNEFLYTLNRNASARRPHPSSSSDEFPQYFDAASLSQLGLTGMPGIPGSGASFSDPGLSSAAAAGAYPHSYHHHHSSHHGLARSSHPSVQPTHFGPIYPSVGDGLSYSSSEDYASHHSHYSGDVPSISGYQRGHMYSSPPFDIHSPSSSVSTPSNATPPHMSVTMPIPDSTSFGYLAEPRGPPPVANLAPVNYHNRSMRDIIPLKAVPGSSSSGPPEPVEPKLQKTVHRGPPAKLIPSSSSRTGSLYPSLALSLTEGDPKLKLAPLNYRSSSPASSSPRSRTDSNSTISRETSPAPSSHSHGAGTVLPSIHSIASRVSPPPVRRGSGSEDLTEKVAEINLDRESERMNPADHSKLIWQLFVAINMDYKKRIGTPPPPVKMEEEESSMDSVGRDVEMVAAC